MENLLLFFIVVVGIIVITSILNERKLHMPHDIVIMLVAAIISLVILGIQSLNIFDLNIFQNFFKDFQLSPSLLECMLGFIVFAEASKSHLHRFVKNIVPISYLVIVGTLVSAVVYGVIFYGINILFHLEVNFWVCLLLGAILSPMESATAVGALKEKNASKSLISVIEGEAFFNDGIGIAIFVFVTEIIQKGTMPNFLLLILKEFVSATLIGLGISYLFFQLLKMTKEPVIHILISLLVIFCSQFFCEYFDSSILIASVISGMYFSYQNRKLERWREVVDAKELYYDFWDVLENLLNRVLFVLVGLFGILMKFQLSTLILIPIAILLNLIARYFGVFISTCLMGKKKIPAHYSFQDFVKFMTWGGLKGGLPLVLIISVKDLIAGNDYNILLNMTMVTILFTTIIQGLTIGKVYQRIEKTREERMLLLKK